MITLCIIFLISGFLLGAGITAAILHRSSHRVSQESWKAARRFYTHTSSSDSRP